VAASLGQLDLEEGLRSARPAEPLLLAGWPPRWSRPWAATAAAPTGSAGTSSASAPVDHDRVGAITAAPARPSPRTAAGSTSPPPYGTVLLPEESQDVTEAMRLVDQRIYAQ
jgi:hypothetical protein